MADEGLRHELRQILVAAAVQGSSQGVLLAATRREFEAALDRFAAATPPLRAAEDATNALVVAFRRWHLDRHGYAPTVHDFRLMLDMATDANVLRRYRAAELTEGQAAQKLGLDRLSFREHDAATDEAER